MKFVVDMNFMRWLLWFLAFTALPCPADVFVERTRIIYPQSRKDISFSLANASPSDPAVVQIWTDNGDSEINLDPENIDTPFQVSPAVVRLGQNGRQAIRIAFTGEPQNAEQETLYWFNILELPTAYKGSSDVGHIALGRRTRIKLFFRPTGLKGDPQQAMKTLRCGLTSSDNAWWLDCHNPSVFHLSFIGFSVGNTTGIQTVSDGGGMLKPRERARFKVKDFDKLPQPITSLAFDFINDLGGISSVYSQIIAP